jgi:hypothetical protein
MTKKYQSEQLMVCHQDAEALYQIGAISDAEMGNLTRTVLFPILKRRKKPLPDLSRFLPPPMLVRGRCKPGQGLEPVSPAIRRVYDTNLAQGQRQLKRGKPPYVRATVPAYPPSGAPPRNAPPGGNPPGPPVITPRRLSRRLCGQTRIRWDYPSPWFPQ